MNIIFKFLICILCTIGIIVIWQWLNDISAGNVSGIGLGDFILMFIGLRTISRTIYNEICRFNKDGD